MGLGKELRRRIVGLRLDDRIAPTPFFVLEVPFASTRLVLPRGAPPSTIDFLFFSIHFIQASMPFLCCSGVACFIAFSKSAPEAMYKTMNFFIASSSLTHSAEYVAHLH